MSNNKPDIKFAERTKPSRGDIEAAKPKTEEAQPKAPEQPPRLTLKRFPNGMPLGYSPNPRKPGTWVLHDATGTPLAMALHQEMAEMICHGVFLLFVEQDKAQKKQLEAIDALNDSAEAAVAADAEHPAGQDAKPFVPIAAPDLKVVAPDSNPPASNT